MNFLGLYRLSEFFAIPGWHHCIFPAASVCLSIADPAGWPEGFCIRGYSYDPFDYSTFHSGKRGAK